MTRILVAGMGNVLRQDDGFGVAVAGRLAAQKEIRPNLKIIEVGIGGIHLVQELMDGYDVLLLIDAMERGSAPGTMHIFRADVPDLASDTTEEYRDLLADMHYTVPSKALMLAKALGVLPPRVFMVGCQPMEANEVGIGLSEPVALAADRTIVEIEKIIQTLVEAEPVNELAEGAWSDS